MSAQQFDAYGGVVPYMRNGNRRAEGSSRGRRRGRVGPGVFWLAVVLLVLARIVCFATAQPSGFANVEGAHQVGVR